MYTEDQPERYGELGYLPENATVYAIVLEGLVGSVTLFEEEAKRMAESLAESGAWSHVEIKAFGLAKKAIEWRLQYD